MSKRNAPQSIIRGIVQATSILAIGVRSETCPNWKKSTGKSQAKAEKVRTQASLRERKFGRKANIFLKYSWVKSIPSTARKLSCKLTS